MSRILVTHAGGLIRPGELPSFLTGIDRGKRYDEDAYPAHEHEWRSWEDVPLPEGKDQEFLTRRKQVSAHI